MTNKVLLTDGNLNSTYAVIRSLGKRKIFIGCTGNKGDKFLYSRYITKKEILPDYKEYPKEYVQELIKKVEKEKYSILIPMTDASLFLINENRHKFPKFLKIPLPDEQSIRISMDKEKTLKIAEKLKIPIPKTYFIKNINELNGLAEKIMFPAVIKPKKSVKLTNNKLQKASVACVFVFNKKEMMDNYKKINEKDPLPLIQEKINGEEIGLFFLFDKGDEVACFSHKRIKSFNPEGGFSILSKSTKIDLNLKNQSVKLLKYLKWNGVAMVEFKKDEKDGKFKLMEINPRFWGSLQLAVSSGVDFPYMLYQLSQGKKVRTPEKYLIGKKLRWVYGNYLRLTKIIINPKLSKKCKIKEVAEFLRFYEKNTDYTSFFIDDPLVGFIEILQTSKEIISDILRRIKNA